MNTKFKQRPWLLPVLFLFAGLIFGWIFFGGSPSPEGHSAHIPPEAAEQHPQVWTCSMHPSIREDGPGTCPICAMALIPASSVESDNEYEMAMTEASVSLADIQTSPATRQVPDLTVSAIGKITPNETTLSRVTGNFHGRITNLYVNFTGAPVSAGQPLFSIYSDDLITAQRELIEAARTRELNPALFEATRQKLLFWDLAEEQIDEIIENGEPIRHIDILSPARGIITQRNITANSHVYEGDILFEIADLSTVWAQLDLFEQDLANVHTGDTVELSVQAFPGEPFEGAIVFLDPVLDPARRTARARVELNNAGIRLKPEMLVNATIFSASDEEKLLIPRSAVLWTGPRSLVYVQNSAADSPQFESREIELGHRTGDFYIVEAGLEEGERVVTSGAFKIDSEFQLADKFSMMNRQKQEEETGTEGEPYEISAVRFTDVPQAFQELLAEAIHAYIDGKNALVESHLEHAQTAFSAFTETLEEIGVHGLAGDGHAAWMESYEALMAHANPITETDDIETARGAFRVVSDELIKAVHMFGIEGVVYHQYCPMAFDDEGANWLSAEEQIQNPYLPETMLMCGEVIERIEE